MNNKLSFLFIAALLISHISFAHIFRIGYPGPQLAGIDFTPSNAADAVSAASAGDTIQIYPSATAPNVASLSKQLVFVGMGYFLTNNTGLQVSTTSSVLYVTMAAGASGSVFEGLQISGSVTSLGGTTLQNILFTRCYLTSYQFYTQVAGDSIKNITFSQCYSSSYVTFYNQSVTNSTISGIDFQNCICDGSYAGYFAISGGGIITNITFENCSCYYYSALETGAISCYYRNCIFQYEPNAVNNDVFDYCTFTSNNATHYVTGTSDQFGKAITAIYSGGGVITSGTGWDASWKLVSGSPCIGYGKDNGGNAIDAGAYGGVVPYRLSGIPAVPAFYILSAPSSSATANPYTITFSVRANN